MRAECVRACLRRTILSTKTKPLTRITFHLINSPTRFRLLTQFVLDGAGKWHNSRKPFPIFFVHIKRLHTDANASDDKYLCILCVECECEYISRSVCLLYTPHLHQNTVIAYKQSNCYYRKISEVMAAIYYCQALLVLRRVQRTPVHCTPYSTQKMMWTPLSSSRAKMSEAIRLTETNVIANDAKY